VRVWRLYLRAARRGFESGFISVYQVRAHRPGAPVKPLTTYVTPAREDVPAAV
jgi:hypothetical protein